MSTRGPQPFEFPDATAVMQQVFTAAFTEAPPPQSTGELAAQAGQDTPERRAMSALYAQMDDLPPTLQMFLAGCPAELEAKRDRISCRQLVMRTLLALADGVHRTAYWNLAPEYPGPVDDRQMMYLLIGKLPLLGYEGDGLDHRHPAADTFALLAGQLAGRTDRDPRRDQRPAHAPRVRGRPRRARAPARALGPPRHLRRRGRTAGTITWPWPAATATITDVFGQAQTVQGRDGQIRLPVSVTPVFVTEQPPAAAS